MLALVYTEYSAFGWNVSKVVCPDGHAFLAEPSKAGLRSEGPNITLHTKGRLHCVCLTDSEPVVTPRVPGTSTLELLPIRVGKFRFTAEGECQWWCFSRFANNLSLPNAQPFSIAAGETRAFDVGTKVFLCDGDAMANGVAVNGPISIHSTSNVISVTAGSAVYGFVFAEWV